MSRLIRVEKREQPSHNIERREIIMVRKELNYSRDIEIDPEALDVEWLNQPNLFLAYSQKKAEADREAKLLHEEFKSIKAELRLQAAKLGAKGLGVKDTSDNLDAWVRNQEDYKEAKEKLIEAEYEADMLSAAVYAFNHRRSALENLAKLHGQQYFAGPTEPRNLPEKYNIAAKAHEKQQKNVNRKIREASKRSRKK